MGLVVEVRIGDRVLMQGVTIRDEPYDGPARPGDWNWYRLTCYDERSDVAPEAYGRILHRYEDGAGILASLIADELAEWWRK